MDTGELIRIATEKRRVLAAAIEGAVVHIDSGEERGGLRAAHWDYSRSVDALISALNDVRTGTCLGKCPYLTPPKTKPFMDGFSPLTLN